MNIFKVIVAAFIVLIMSGCATSQNTETYWIDVRSAEEYQAKHLANTINISHQEITDEIANVTRNKDAIIYLHCRSGRRADTAMAALEQLGYTQVENLRTMEGMESKMKSLGLIK